MTKNRRKSAKTKSTRPDHSARKITPVGEGVPTPQEINALVALFTEGRYTEALVLANGLTLRFPLHGFGWKVLGAVFNQVGQSTEALEPTQKSATLMPGDAEAQNNLGNVQKCLGRADEAVASYRLALKINPAYAIAHFNLGIALKDLGRLEDAVSSYRQALEIKPDYTEAHGNLGNALQGLGRLDAALMSYRHALEIRPDYAIAHCNLGNALKDQGRLDDAVASYRLALELKADFTEAHNNLGIALKDLGQLDDAVASYRQALRITADYAEAHNNLGIALKDLGALGPATASYHRALEIKPNYIEAYSNLGNVLRDLGQLDDALSSYRRALKIFPDYAEAHSNLGNALLDIGRVDDAVANYRLALEINPELAEVRSNLLFIHNYRSDQNAETLLAEARNFGDLMARRARPHAEWENDFQTDRRLRVGLVSGDLRIHPVGYFVESVLAVLNTHAADRLEFFAYPSYFCADTVSERIKRCCRGWHPAVGLSDENLARRIRLDRIDILIDLSGHTMHNRLPLFAWRPAPVQAAWLGYLATTGVTAMDYLIADPWTLPASEEAHFTEKIWRLPDTYLCFTPPAEADEQVAALPALTNGHVTFGSFNNLNKLNDAVVALWARVLASVPNSRLLLKAKQLKEPMVRQTVVDRFAAHGVDTGRLTLMDLVPRAGYLALYRQVDIALDPFPYPGITTSVESLWMGVPVLSLTGDRFLSRQGVGLLMNAGLPEWIAADPDDYVDRAASHAGNLLHLATLRQELRQRVSATPLFDAPRFAIHFEAALRGMWTKWCSDKKPAES